MTNKLVFALFLAAVTHVWGQQPPKGYIIPKSTMSPDHRYGVTVPVLSEHLSDDQTTDVRNSLVELKTGRALAAIQGNPGYDRMNHGEVLPSRWSRDGSLLLWEVQGKWFPDALNLLKIGNGEVKWQTDLLKTAQQEILVRTQQAAPQKYAAAKQANAGSGSAFPEGFSVDVETTGQIALPLHVRAALTSDPKALGNLPELTSHLEGTVDRQGKFAVTSFHLGKGHWRPYWEPEPSR